MKIKLSQIIDALPLGKDAWNKHNRDFLAQGCRILEAMIEWTPASIPPDKTMLNEDGWGFFLCYVPSEKLKIERYRVGIYSTTVGWNYGRIKYWVPLPIPPVTDKQG
jgi:hypothetical protein